MIVSKSSQVEKFVKNSSTDSNFDKMFATEFFELPVLSSFVGDKKIIFLIISA